MHCMKNSSRKALGESVGMACGAILLGSYLSSTADHLAIQAAMLSFPPASLWFAIRYNRLDEQPRLEQLPLAEIPELPLAATVAQTLEVERLVQAS
jgi:hypothetical protein